MPLGLDGERIDRALAGLTGLARRRSRLLIEGGDVWLNARPCRVLSRDVHTGDVVDVLQPEEPLQPPQPPPNVEILLDDGWLVAVNKPAGAHSQRPRRASADELSMVELCALAVSARYGRRTQLGLFHRLDRVTSGVLVFTRHHEASRGLDRAWRDGKVEKRYLAVVVGDPGEGLHRIDEPLAPDPAVPGRFRVDRHGRAARTEFQRIAALDGLALVEARPATGRTHQVRIHLEHAGHPVAGDHLYGGGATTPRPYLHAWRLTLPHPKDRKRIRIEAPLPEDMATLLASLGFDSASLAGR